MIQKVTSRKFLISIVGVIVGLAISFLGGDAESQIQLISGNVVSAVSIVTYILAEASIDKAAVKKDEVNTDES